MFVASVRIAVFILAFIILYAANIKYKRLDNERLAHAEPNRSKQNARKKCMNALK